MPVRKKVPRVRRKVAKKKVIKKIAPSVTSYEQIYPGNPVFTALKKLKDQGILDLPMDDTRYLADQLADLIAEEIVSTSLGAAIIRRLNTWIKGLKREDTLP